MEPAGVQLRKIYLRGDVILARYTLMLDRPGHPGYGACMNIQQTLIALSLVSLAACSSSETPKSVEMSASTPIESHTPESNATAQQPADAFFARLGELCGKSFGGKLAVFNESDLEGFSGAAVMHVRDCSATEIRIPFHVGENRSRTWIVTRTADGLRLKHDHRHEDGSSDKLTMYGGDTQTPGSETRQEFPADAESKAMFDAGGMSVSNDNIWAIEVHPGSQFAYELRRPNRHFRVEFDLTKEVPTPPPAWGSDNATGQ